MISVAIMYVATVLPTVDPVLAKYASAYYDIESDLPPQRVQQLGKIMDAAGKEYDRRFTGYSGKVNHRLKLKVFAKKSDFVEAVKRSAEGSKAAWTSGVFVPLDETVYTYDSPQMEHVLRHECFHQFTHFVVGGHLDTWVNEGLAEYFGVGQVDASGTLKLGNLDHYRVGVLTKARDEGTLMSVDEVLHITGRGWHDNMGTDAAATQYAQAWALCHFLIHGDGAKYQQAFDQYLRLIDKHLDGSSAFKRVFGEDTKPLQERYSAYLDSMIDIVAAEDAKKASRGIHEGG